MSLTLAMRSPEYTNIIVRNVKEFHAVALFMVPAAISAPLCEWMCRRRRSKEAVLALGVAAAIIVTWSVAMGVTWTGMKTTR